MCEPPSCLVRSDRQRKYYLFHAFQKRSEPVLELVSTGASELFDQLQPSAPELQQLQAGVQV